MGQCWNSATAQDYSETIYIYFGCYYYLFIFRLLVHRESAGL
jgi:hypothetical protein